MPNSFRIFIYSDMTSATYDHTSGCRRYLYRFAGFAGIYSEVSVVFALSALSYSESYLRSLSIISSLNSVRKKTSGEKMRELLLNRQKQNFSPQVRSTDSAQRDIKCCCCPNLSKAQQIVILRKYPTFLPARYEYC